MRTLILAASLITLFVIPLHAVDNRSIADAAFDELVNQDFTALSKRFSPEMSAAMPAENLPTAIGPVLKSLGNLRSGRPEPNVISSQGYEVFVYPAEFQKWRNNSSADVDLV